MKPIFGGDEDDPPQFTVTRISPPRPRLVRGDES
jgi:hypothetical protein